MKRFKKLLHHIFFPQTWIMILSILAASVLLIDIFAGGQKESLGAVVVYVFSAYSMILVCARIGAMTEHTRKNMQAVISRIPLAHRYFSDISFRLHISLYISLCLNVIYAVMKFLFGFRYHSVWFGTLAVYYFLLAVMRFLLLYHVSRNGFGVDLNGELRRYRLCGMILMIMNLALTAALMML